MQEIFSIVQRIAKTMSTVLISGESGTGKELIARAIHYNSGRRGKFVSINCGALPENLLESELFGHERGAFTGAIREKKGLFHEADRGTIFLDEIGDTTPAMQIKLLRVLQDRMVRGVGSNVESPADVRVIAATNRDLAGSIREGTFREDLFYRINVIPIMLPPLRSRTEDIPLLVDHFIEKFCTRMEVARKRISADAMRAIEKYHWPGNVRELENVDRADDRSGDLRPPDHEVAAGARAPRRAHSRRLVRAAGAGTLAGRASGGHHQDLHAARPWSARAASRPRPRSCCEMSFRSFRYYAKKYDLIPRDRESEEVAQVENK